MLLGMLHFILFHECTEARKVISLMNEYVNRKHKGYGNEGTLCDAFILFRNNAQSFFFCFFEG